MSSSTRRWLGRALLSLGATVAALVVAELGLRWWAPGGVETLIQPELGMMPASLFQRDAQLGQWMRPNQQVEYATLETRATLRTNSLGLRGPEPARPPGGLRVLNLGDSFVFAAQVDELDSSSAVLGRALSARLGRPVEVINAGLDAAGTRRENIVFRRFVDVLRPDLVLLDLFMGNDLLDNHGHDELAPLSPDQERARFARQTRNARWSRRSRLFAYALAFQRAWVRDPELVGLLHEEVEPFTDPARLQALLPATRVQLERFAGICAARSLPCAISLIPPAWAAEPERVPATLRLAGLSGRTLDYDGAVSAVRGIIPAGLTVVDLLPALRAADDPYLVFDPHWSVAGQRAAGEAEAAALAPILSGPTRGSTGR